MPVTGLDASGSAEGQIGAIFYKEDLIAQSIDFVDGSIRVPTGPGLGIDVDPAKIEKYRVDD